MHFLLIYETVPDYVALRSKFRAAHLSYAQAAVDRGELILGGAAGDPVDSAVLVFSANSEDIPRIFAENDPYVINGLVSGWQIKPWHTVVGPTASNAVITGNTTDA
ncbi:YciI-like protein [Alteromonas gilva]|uniref:YciI-like protein n=1 Tax=Alteromonas gilva TaxID=2987522 RepID=A0ABT5KWT2_9ALTE|nr:YciI-like protein [Alteromonas gilva]MDC8829216.1 YciI-like protein [Alteromonas gilva]